MHISKIWSANFNFIKVHFSLFRQHLYNAIYWTHSMATRTPQGFEILFYPSQSYPLLRTECSKSLVDNIARYLVVKSFGSLPLRGHAKRIFNITSTKSTDVPLPWRRSFWQERPKLWALPVYFLMSSLGKKLVREGRHTGTNRRTWK